LTIIFRDQILKVLVFVGKLVSPVNSDYPYELELVDAEELALENFNRKLNNQEEIKPSMTFNSFLKAFAVNLSERSCE